MKPSAPIGQAVYGPLLIRVALGAYFILAGLVKLQNPTGFITEIQSMGVLPSRGAMLFGIVLPYIEIAVGTLLLVGFWTVLAAMLTSALLVSFVIAVGLKPGAFAPFNKDIILLAASISIMYSGAGAFSVDRFRTSG